jgi:transcriptional regulator with XRE-family HTH domain
MRHLKYDIKVAKAIKLIREFRQVKQIVLANALGMTQANYSKIEQGEIAITSGELKIISKELNVSPFQIISIIDIIDEETLALNEMLNHLSELFEANESINTIGFEELNFILQEILNSKNT